MTKINLSKYSSKKHPVLEYIFKKYYSPSQKQKFIVFYLSDISEGYKYCKLPEPVSISNTILDLCRQDRGIDSRLPKSISSLGYDLRKKTGGDTNGKKFAGEFVLVEPGKTLGSWLIWPDKISEIIVSSKHIPEVVKRFIRPDEGGIFSVIDYCDVLTKVFDDGRKIFRVQNPMKWQPNEIDGFYVSCLKGEEIELHPIEAKSLTTGDDINLDQLSGAFRTIKEKLKKMNLNVDLRQIAVKSTENAIDIAIFSQNTAPGLPEKFCRVRFAPLIPSWKK